jgi:hypothetical protein
LPYPYGRSFPDANLYLHTTNPYTDANFDSSTETYSNIHPGAYVGTDSGINSRAYNKPII